MAQIYPSLLPLDVNTIDHYVKELEPLCPGFHIDIMDNTFVPNTGISVEKTNQIATRTYRTLWVHLMVEKPHEYLNQLQMPAGSLLTFHIESHKDTKRLIKDILEKKWRPGIAISPKTGVEEIMGFLDTIDQVLIMSVEPGFSGARFLKETMDKIDPLLAIRHSQNLHFKIAMDGGIDLENIKIIAERGVDEIAVGSGIFKYSDAAQAYRLLSERIA